MFEDDVLPFIPKDTQIDIVTSGMPCETFSTAGSKSRSFYDHRQYLFKEDIRIAKMVNAKLILFENVPGITTKTVEKHGSRLIIEELFDELKNQGYKYYIDATLNSADFGVPQLRDRYFVLASKEKRNLKFPNYKKDKYTTVKDALIDMPNVEVTDPGVKS